MDSKIYQKNLLIPSIKFFLDILAIETAFVFSYYLRFYSLLTRLFPVTKGIPPFINYLIASLIVLVIFVSLFMIFHSYRSRYFSSFSQDIPVILKTCLLGIVFAMSGAFLYRGFSYSRLTFLFVFLTTILFLFISRFFFHRIKTFFMRKGYGINKLVAVGSPLQLSRFFYHFNRTGSSHIKIAGYCAEKEVPNSSYVYLGKVENLTAILDEFYLDGLLLTFDVMEHHRIVDILKLVEGKNVELFYIPDLLDLITTAKGSVEISGIQLLQLRSVAFSGWQGFLKRSFDLISSMMGLMIFSPIIFLFSLIIKMTTPGPVFHLQRRIGMDGKEFTMLKFRTMKVDAEKETGAVWAEKNDPRVTRFGRFLRRTSLDELPQLVNVLKGEMSIVGPRPERQIFVEQFKENIPQYSDRHRVRSGMTGWAQVNGLRGQSSITDRTRFDIYYVENWSLGFDIKIIFLTFAAIFRGENAY